MPQKRVSVRDVLLVSRKIIASGVIYHGVKCDKGLLEWDRTRGAARVQLLFVMDARGIAALDGARARACVIHQKRYEVKIAMAVAGAKR